MTATATRTDFELFRALVATRFGLHHEDGKLDFLGDILRGRMDATGCTRFDAYVERLESTSTRDDELRALAEQLTVGETYFFRNEDHFRAISEVVLPELVRTRARTRRLRILSAGCASGEEPYSLAIALHRAVPDLASWDARIVGIDINAASLARASLGRFSAWSLRSTSAENRRAYFRTDGRDFVLDPAIQRMVTFEEKNLVDDDSAFWEQRFDVVLCRNVIMYFTPEAMRAVVHRVGEALDPGGYLFLGHAETLRGLSSEFHLCHTHDTFYYRRRSQSDDPSVSAGAFAPDPSASASSTFAVVADDANSWIEVIQRASERIEKLSDSCVHSRDDQSRIRAEAVCVRSRDLGLVLEAMRQERFADALTLLGNVSPDGENEPDALLLRAVLLTNTGALSDAEQACTRLLALDELNAGAHYVMALCREHAGDVEGAVDHDQIAIYLDADFAMPHVHQGLMARRAGDVDAAQRALGEAWTLLAREDAARLLLFGGGFSRDALLQLCRTALQTVGGEG